MYRHKLSLLTLMLAVFVMVPGSAVADNHPDHAEISNWLGTLERSSAELRREAAQLESLNRSDASWMSHSRYLTTVKHHVNYMGAIVADLQDLRSVASPDQQRAIDAATPALKSIADHTEKAIRMLNADRRSISKEDYRDVIASLHGNADSLYSMLDALDDYTEAKKRLPATK